MKRQPEQPFLAATLDNPHQIEKRRGQYRSIFHNTNPAGLLHYEQSPRAIAGRGHEYRRTQARRHYVYPHAGLRRGRKDTRREQKNCWDNPDRFHEQSSDSIFFYRNPPTGTRYSSIAQSPQKRKNLACPDPTFPIRRPRKAPHPLCRRPLPTRGIPPHAPRHLPPPGA